MSQRINPVRGTQDFYGIEAQKLRLIESQSFHLAQLFGYQELRTPIFELSSVFHRSLGETSDAVTKETYDFIDRGGDSLTLRPEGTAGAVRAAISENLLTQLPLKLYYAGPMFRHERPQKGRYRQFHQFGVEVLGWDDPWADVECIELGWRVLESLKLTEQIRLEVNTIGSFESRKKHREALVHFLTPKKEQLSPASQERLEKNPLRILDSKDPKDQELVDGAPTLKDFLTPEDLSFYEKVLSGLRKLEIPFTENSKLVRGFDYYTHTVFEFVTDQLGAQGTVLAGGRYNGLVELFGGPSCSGVGWAAGFERMALMLPPEIFQADSPAILILPLDDSCSTQALELATKLRKHNLKAQTLTSGKLQKRLQKANKLGAKYCIMLGPDELASQQVAIKDLSRGDQSLVPLDKFEKFFLDLKSV